MASDNSRQGTETKNRVLTKKLGDNAARFKKELEMNVGSKKAQIEVEEDTTLNNTTSGQQK